MGLLFAVWYGCSLPGGWLSNIVWRRSSSAAFCRFEDLCRQVDLQQLWGPMFRGCQPYTILWNSLPAGLRQI